MALDRAFSRKINDHFHGVASLTMPTGFRCRQMTANGTAAANGTELATSGGYTSGTGAPTLGFDASTNATPTVNPNTAAVTITNMPATTIVGIEIWEGTPLRIEYGALTASKTTTAGDTLTYAIGAITSALQ